MSVVYTLELNALGSSKLKRGIESTALPRVGEYVVLADISHEVIAVFHYADGSAPQVRVRVPT